MTEGKKTRQAAGPYNPRTPAQTSTESKRQVGGTPSKRTPVPRRNEATHRPLRRRSGTFAPQRTSLNPAQGRIRGKGLLPRTVTQTKKSMPRKVGKYDDVTGISRRNKGSTKRAVKNPIKK